MRKGLRFFVTLMAPVATLVLVVEGWKYIRRISSGNREPAHLEAPRSVPRPTVEVPMAGTLTKVREITQVPLTDPVDLVVSGHWLVVLDPASAGRLTVVNAKSMTVYNLGTQLLSVGIRRAFHHAGLGRDGVVFLKNAGEKAAVQLRIRSQEPLKFDAVSLDIKATPGAGALWGVSDTEVVANGLFADKLLVRLHLGAGQLVPIASVSGSVFPEVTAEKVALSLNRNWIAVHPVDQRVAQAFLFSSRLHLYSKDGSLERMMAGPADAKLVYNVRFDNQIGIDRFIMHEDTRFYYIDVTADSEYIYALFSGRRNGAFNGDAGYGDQVHIFGWNGSFVGSWRVPEPVAKLKCGGSPLRLWGVRRTPTPAIVEYELPFLDGSERQARRH